MKQVKTAYEKCKAKLPNRPPDEIDFGLGFRAAAGWILEELDVAESHQVFCARIIGELDETEKI